MSLGGGRPRCAGCSRGATHRCRSRSGGRFVVRERGGPVHAAEVAPGVGRELLDKRAHGRLRAPVITAGRRVTRTVPVARLCTGPVSRIGGNAFSRRSARVHAHSHPQGDPVVCGATGQRSAAFRGRRNSRAACSSILRSAPKGTPMSSRPCGAGQTGAGPHSPIVDGRRSTSSPSSSKPSAEDSQAPVDSGCVRRSTSVGVER